MRDFFYLFTLLFRHRTKFRTGLFFQNYATPPARTTNLLGPIATSSTVVVLQQLSVRSVGAMSHSSVVYLKQVHEVLLLYLYMYHSMPLRRKSGSFFPPTSLPEGTSVCPNETTNLKTSTTLSSVSFTSSGSRVVSRGDIPAKDIAGTPPQTIQIGEVGQQEVRPRRFEVTDK